MGRSKDTYNKKEVRKKQEKKRKEKEAKKLAKKSGEKTGADDMIAYVDEFGRIVSEPPDITQKEDIKVEDIAISVPKDSELGPEDNVRTGVVAFFNEQKGYGFIKEKDSNLSFFVHINDIEGEIKEGNRVTFEVGKGPKGPVAINVSISK